MVRRFLTNLDRALVYEKNAHIEDVEWHVQHHRCIGRPEANSWRGHLS